MPLQIDLAFKWGSGKKKEEPPKPSAPKEEESSNATCTTTCSCTSSASSSASSSSSSDLSVHSTQHSHSVQATQTGGLSTAIGRPLSNRRLVVFVRHAERVDRVFPAWLTLAHSNGAYRPYDTNLPRRLPNRRGGLGAFANDPPLTRLGQTLAVLCGKSMAMVQFRPTCLETAHLISVAMSSPAKIRVEPGLFDFAGWYLDGVPVWLTENEMVGASLAIDRRYKPIESAQAVMGRRGETEHDFYRRIHAVVSKINKTAAGESVLIVGHASTMDAGVRSLLGLSRAAPKFLELDRMGDRYPYCSSFVLEQTKASTQFTAGKTLQTITTGGQSSALDKKYLLR
ncbi:hypothetical protein M3Y99_01590300 [Aphelenchoides fujianensis]|nr:hypothetical protein M3Y99_01590300 [Aphelenchoides fujianensis]